MAGVLFVGGLSRSLQFTSVNAVAYADVPSDRLSSATSFNSVLQQLSGSIGITLAAFGLEAMQGVTGAGTITREMFAPVFLLVGAVSLLSVVGFVRLPKSAGAALLPKSAAAE
jgi:hypothetical protein